MAGPYASLFAAALMLLTSCSAACQVQVAGTGDRSIPYVLQNPVLSARLPKALTEISGLAVVDSIHVAAVQDEDGIIYLLDAASGEVVSEHRFGDPGDYEALEAVGNRMYVLRSDGVLFEVPDWRNATPGSVVRHSTPLSSRNDTEGLSLSLDGQHLLIACKEYPGKGFKGKRTIYQFSLSSGRLDREPVVILDAEAAEAYQPEGAISRAVRRLLDVRRFKPSGVAVHPFTGDMYVVSSVSRSLSVFDADGRLVAAALLDKDLLPQPEGIIFLPGGDMMLASEGKGGRAALARYTYSPL